MIFDFFWHIACCSTVDCSTTPNPNFYFDLLLFHLAHGFTRPQKTPKIHETKFVTYLKAENEETLEKIFFKIFFRLKPFLKNKKNAKQSLILNSIFGNWS